ncbi:MAG: hypothetical protein KDA89_13620 [Planctomycetaceae bacterium]|nr:hypothetical protein [Planctomycetaceae bacterium]
MVSADIRSHAGHLQKMFAEWPVSIPRTGVILTEFGEAIPFKEFMICGDLLLLERPIPDIVGARRVIFEFRQIAAVKIVDAVEMSRFTAFGFRGAVGGATRQ